MFEKSVGELSMEDWSSEEGAGDYRNTDGKRN